MNQNSLILFVWCLLGRLFLLLRMGLSLMFWGCDSEAISFCMSVMSCWIVLRLGFSICLILSLMDVISCSMAVSFLMPASLISWKDKSSHSRALLQYFWVSNWM